jgi:hypothetical protein
MLIELAIITPLVISGALKREAQDEVDRSNYPTIVKTWKVPAGFDSYANLQQCLVKHGHRINAANVTRTVYVTEGIDEDGRKLLTITRWKPEEGDIKPRSVPTARTAALQCAYEDGKLWNARLSQFNGTWIAANLPQETQ